MHDILTPKVLNALLKAALALEYSQQDSITINDGEVMDDTPANRSLFRKEPRAIEMPILPEEEPLPNLTQPCNKVVKLQTKTDDEGEPALPVFPIIAIEPVPIQLRIGLLTNERTKNTLGDMFPLPPIADNLSFL